MPLESGLYQIVSAYPEGKPFVGRNNIETPVVEPKAVVRLPEGAQAPPPFEFEKVEGDLYIIKLGRDPVVQIDNKIFAIPSGDLTVQPPPWKIINDELKGPGAFVITEVDGPSGWVSPSEEDISSQILFRPLIVGRSLPPFYPPNEVFFLKRVVL